MTHEELNRNIEDFVVGMYRGCKDCSYGDQVRCCHETCPAYRARALARFIEEARNERPQNVVSGNRVGVGYAVEREIVAILKRFGEPVPVNQIKLRTTASRVQKCVSITNLVRKGEVIEERRGDFKIRYISLAPNKNKENKENAGKEHGSDGGADQRAAGGEY